MSFAPLHLRPSARVLSRVGAWTAALGLTWALTSCSGGQTGAPTFDTVTRGSVSNGVTASGALAARSSEQLGFPQGGKLTSVRVKVGQKVEAGDVLATIDSRAAEATLAQAEANVDAQGGAYATGVLVLITSASVAVTLSARRRGQRRATIGFGVVAAVFVYTTVVNVVERPEGAATRASWSKGLRGPARRTRSPIWCQHCWLGGSGCWSPRWPAGPASSSRVPSSASTWPACGMAS